MAKLSYSIGNDLGDHGVEKTTPLKVLNGTCETSFQPGIGVTNFSGRRSWKRRWHFQNSTSTRALFGKDVQHESLRCPKKKQQNIWVPRNSSTVCLCLRLHGETFMHGWKSSELSGDSMILLVGPLPKPWFTVGKSSPVNHHYFTEGPLLTVTIHTLHFER